MDICSRKSHYFCLRCCVAKFVVNFISWHGSSSSNNICTYWTGSIGMFFSKLQRLIWVGVNGCCYCCSTFPLREDNAIWPSRVPKKFCCLLTCNWLLLCTTYSPTVPALRWRLKKATTRTILYFHANTTAQEPGGKRDREPYHQNGNEKNKVPNCSRACVLFVISLLTNAAATVLYHMIVVLLASRPLLTISAICKCAFWKGSFLAFWTIT